MKYLSSIILLACSTFVSAQSDITPQVSNALKKGDAAGLANLMMPQIELTLNGSDQTVSKAEAQKQLVVFFKERVPSDFTVKHQGTSKLDDQYRIGDLITSQGNYRVTFFMKKDGSLMLIRQLKIETSRR